jgi:two-component system, cell cycle sensor histidine kinase and response regulator CckA
MGSKSPIGTILVADDDDAQRIGISGLLERLGFAVIQANNGQEAVGKYNIHHDGIALVIMDISLPRVDGIDATKRIRGIDPASKILFCCNHIDQLTLDLMPEAFVHKPFNGRVLWDTVQQVLGFERRHVALRPISYETALK